MSPVNQKVIEKFGEKWTQPANFVGNGAYVLKNWTVNERIELEHVVQPIGTIKIRLSIKSYFLPISSEVTDVKPLYRAGEIDMTYSPICRLNFSKN